ncbi:MAG: GNAT family N-acetyltransferase [Phycisphaerales bacterium]
MIRYQRIDRQSPLYAGERELRELVLLRPLGLDVDRFMASYPAIEEGAEHFVAVMGTPGGDRVIGCALLVPKTDTPGLGKLMQMAVHPQRQGEGIGRRIVIEVEKRAFAELELDRLYCHAQLDAIPFYERLGWSADEEVFQEAGIPHRRMTLSRPEMTAEPVPVPDW